jgi:hypothetical protein
VLPDLRVAAVFEAVSLVVLLRNLVTIHLRAVTQLAGPVHGCAYLAAVVLALSLPTLPMPCPAGNGRSALLPGVGGRLVLRRVEANSG